MTRKDFQLIADAIREARTNAKGDPYMLHGVDLASHALTNALASSNARFDANRFLAACGVE